MASDSSSASSARMEVVQCERDIQTIKAALRQVSGSDENKPNSLEVVWTKMEGIDETHDGLQVALQLSAPLEDATLTAMRVEGDDAMEGSSVSFAGVEASMATLTVSLKDKEGKLLGTSEALDMAPICSLGDALKPKDEYVTDLPVAIVAAPGEEAAFKKENEAEEEKPKEDPATEKEGETEEKDTTKEEEEQKPESTDTKEEETASAVIKPLCTVSLKLIFKPSAKDQKEELYELLNKASLRRSQALDRHRGEQQQQSAVASKSTPTKKPAVKAGFLNKKSAKADPPESKWMQFYNKYLGPKSLGRGVIFPVAKNYIIFFGAVILFHFKGQELALPAPV